MTTTTQPPASARTTEPARGGALTGTGTLIRFILRRDRVRIPVWLAALTLSVVSTAASFPDLYTTAEQRQSRAELMNSPAASAMSGPGYGLDDYTYGAMLSHEMLGFVAIFVAIMSVLLVVRHTRAEEETGRAELLRAAVVGRFAHTTAAVVVVGATNIVFAALLTLTLGGQGLESVDWVGSFAFSAALAGVGLVFTGVAAVTVQITEHARGASGMALALVGAAYGLRAVGDVGSEALSWLSPIGWAQQMRAYVDERWLPLVMLLVVAAALVAAALVLSTRRDVGSGLRQPRPGPPVASASLGTPLGFALRLQRGALIGWCIGMFAFGAMYGSVIGDVADFVSDNEQMAEALAEIGGATITDSFLTIIISMLATVSTVYGILAVQRMRSEETAGRAEPILATALSRARWTSSHLSIALAGGAAVMLSSALGLGLSAVLAVDDAGIFSDVIRASLAYVPAIWISVGLAVLLFGALPRALGLAWLVLVYAITLSMMGALLQFPDWMNNLSPFGHVPGIPAEEFTITPIVVLIAITSALVWAGIAAFRRRDLTTN